MMHTLDLLGESVRTLDEAYAATRQYLDVVQAVAQAGIGRGISLKLTQLGLDVDKATAIDNLRRILEHAEPAEFFVRVDMENSPYTEVTLEIFEMLWGYGHRGIGVVLQSALYRSDQDLARMNALGASVRLVKGAYKEPKSVAYQRKADVDAAYLRMAKTLVTDGHYPAIATHDAVMIDAVRQFARERNIAADRFEFQMLYGIRRDLQNRLVKDGYRLRVYIPFGREWFPYFMGRAPGTFDCTAMDWFLERARAIGAHVGPPQPILLGRHVLEMGLKPGPRVGEILKAVYEEQLDGSVTTLEAALTRAKELVGTSKS